MSKYLWYSGATDITGIALAEALHIESGKVKPRGKDIIIGWGTKMLDRERDENVDLGNAKVINHPNAICKNRNKLNALEMLKADRHTANNIAAFYTPNNVIRGIDRGDISFPLIARKKRHQGGKGLLVCLVKSHVVKAIEYGADYFQAYIDIKTEYRLHVFDGKIIYAVEKVENPTESGWINQRKEKVLEHANKNEVNLDNATVDYVLGQLVKEAVLPDQIVRSNKRGWKFSGINTNTIPDSLKNAAIKAVEIMGLDFGAVDCALDMSDHPFIIEINSGPGLQRTSLEKYIAAFTKKFAEIERPAERLAPRARRVAAAAVGRVEEQENQGIDDVALVHMMNAVQSPAEARRLLDLAMRRR